MTQARRDWSGAWFVLPYLTVFAVMLVVPLGISLWLSTTKSDLFGVQAQVGLANFARLFRDPIFLEAVGNTLYFALLTVPALAIAGLALALALNRPGRWATVMRTIFFSSTVLSVTVVTLVWRLVFLPEGGLLGAIAQGIGRTPIGFLNDSQLAMPALALTTFWWCIGLPMVLFLAALQQVPRELYEAAALDRASRWQTLTRITLPAISRTFVLVIIIEIVLQFQLFGQPQLMTLGGPNNATRPIVLWIYETGWRQWELGYAAAAAQVLFAMIMIAALAQYAVVSRKARDMTRSRLALVMVTIAAVLMLLPLLWVVALSLKSNAALMADTNAVFDGRYTLENYGAILGDRQVFRWIGNSLIVALSMTTGVLVLASLAGYGFARFDFPGRNVLFVIVLLGLAVPEQAVIIARHQMFSAAGMHNSYPALILPGLAAPFGVFLMTQFFRAIPRDVDEAAMLDGASRWTIFTKVLLPQTIPAQATLGIFTFLSAWNDYWWPLISATNKEMFTLTVGIASQQMNFAQTEGLGFLMAQAVFAGAPILIVYLFFQRYIVDAVAGAATTR